MHCPRNLKHLMEFSLDTGFNRRERTMGHDEAFTLVVAGVGALTGITGSVLSILNYRRTVKLGRVRLEVSPGFSIPIQANNEHPF